MASLRSASLMLCTPLRSRRLRTRHHAVQVELLEDRRALSLFSTSVVLPVPPPPTLPALTAPADSLPISLWPGTAIVAGHAQLPDVDTLRPAAIVSDAGSLLSQDVGAQVVLGGVLRLDASLTLNQGADSGLHLGIGGNLSVGGNQGFTLSDYVNVTVGEAQDGSV